MAGFALGLLIGGGGVFWLAHGMPASHPANGTAQGLSREDAALARTLLGRVAGEFVGVRRVKYPDQPGDIVYYFDTPTPAGGRLCRVNRYEVAARVVKGEGPPAGDSSDDALSVTAMFGLRGAGGSAKGLCAAYRDFAALIAADGPGEVERAVAELEAAQGEARSGRASFKVSCRDVTSEKEKSCDGLALLRAADLHAISRVISQTADGKALTHIDELQLGEVLVDCKNDDFISFSVEALGSSDSYDPGQVTAVEVARGAYC